VSIFVPSSVFISEGLLKQKNRDEIEEGKMFKKKSIVGIVLVGIIALGVGLGSMSLADTSDEDTLNTQNDMVIEDPQADDVFVGGTPGSCGYLWDEERNGWHRPWDTDSFIPAAEKPEWDEFVSEVPVVIVDPEPVDDQIVGGTPGSCGYVWDSERNGWHRPWDTDSFISPADKPEWNDFIPSYKIVTATVVDSSFSGNEIKMAIGDSVMVSLVSNPSTGFQWGLAEISDESVMEQVNQEFTLPEHDKPLPPGTPGEEIWTFEAIGSGTSTLSMEYSRPWDGGEKAVETFVLTIIVE